MLSVEEVERTILELEKRDTTYATCERLAWLYIVHDHLTQRIVQEKARAAEMDGSPFLSACSGAEIAEIFSDLDVEVQYGGQPLYYYLISAE